VIEDKIFEFLENHTICEHVTGSCDFQQKWQKALAHDLAGICIREYFTENAKLAKENAGLKEELKRHYEFDEGEQR
jgi:hypothetical protein